MQVTLKIFLPSGVLASDVVPRIEPGGMEVCVSLAWPVFLHSPVAFSQFTRDINGAIVYGQDHPQTIAFQDAIKDRQKGKASNERIVSVCRIPLPIQVEEQFSKLGGHAGIELIKYDDHLMMTLFLMGIRSNYMAPIIAPAGFTVFVSPGRNVLANNVAVANAP
jgi:hypothetical protein